MKDLTKKQKADISKAFKDVDRKELVKKLKTSPGTVKQIVRGLLKVGPERARKIEQITGGTVTAKILRPDIFKEAK